MKLVTRRAKFKLDQGQEAVEREGVRDCFPSTLFVCSVLSEIKQNNAFRNPDKKCSKKFSSKQILPMTITFFVDKLLLVEE